MIERFRKQNLIQAAGVLVILAAFQFLPDSMSRAGVRLSVPTWLGIRSDGYWRDATLKTADRNRHLRQALRLSLTRAALSLPGSPQIPDIDEAQLTTQPTYGLLPDVHVDQGHGALFPQPVRPPSLVSWYRSYQDAKLAEKRLRRLDSDLAASRGDPALRSRIQEWAEAMSDATRLAQNIRYLETWTGPLLRYWNTERAHGRLATTYRLADFWQHPSSLSSTPDPSIGELLALSVPRRAMTRSYLPSAPSGLIELPIATDIADPRFIAEVDGALDTHWNQSGWARTRRLKFKIRWTHVPPDRPFAEGRITLADHLAHFPKGMAAMTTGSLTTQVKNDGLVLGPGKIQPRTLAHELGHIMGFGDCYVRTLGSEGFRGLVIQEWDNPYFPDDLMCDNTVGVARAETW